MPTYKNTFVRPVYEDHVIADEECSQIGTLRIKPSSILWKPAHNRKFYKVTLETFTRWITSDEANAEMTEH